MWRNVDEIAKSLHKRNRFSINRGRVLTALYQVEMEKRSKLVRPKNVAYTALIENPVETLAYVLEVDADKIPQEAIDFVEVGLRHHVALS
jgi:hypothetical protein